jgi:hypothetical protein
MRVIYIYMGYTFPTHFVSQNSRYAGYRVAGHHQIAAVNWVHSPVSGVEHGLKSGDFMFGAVLKHSVVR